MCKSFLSYPQMFFSPVAFLISATCSLNPFFVVRVFPVIAFLATSRISFICFFWFVAAFCLGFFLRASLGVRLAAFPLSAFSLSIFRRFSTRSRADVIPRRSISAAEMPDSLERHKTSVSLFVGSVITITLFIPGTRRVVFLSFFSKVPQIQKIAYGFTRLGARFNKGYTP